VSPFVQKRAETSKSVFVESQVLWKFAVKKEGQRQ